MNFISVIVIGYIAVAALIIAILLRDIYFPLFKCRLSPLPKKKTFGKMAAYYFCRLSKPIHFPKKYRKIISWIIICLLGLGIILAVDARFIEPNLLLTSQAEVKICGVNEPIKIALVADIQVGMGKRAAWVEKIVKKIEKIKPDMVLLGGDLIDNEGSALNEAAFLDPLKDLAGKYPIFYILGNHEYGIGGKTQYFKYLWTGDRSQDLIQEMGKIGIPLLRNQLKCLPVKNQNICIFGADDIWERPINFSELKQWDQKTPLIFFVHNPDGILYWPDNFKQPSIELTGHTHGGQVWLPFIGPLGDAEIDLGKKYYKGLNYYGYTPIYTTAGAGESGGPIRLFDPPEISVITLTP